MGGAFGLVDGSAVGSGGKKIGMVAIFVGPSVGKVVGTAVVTPILVVSRTKWVLIPSRDSTLFPTEGD